MALISVNDLHFSYDPAGPEILTGINLDIAPGERVAILGGNGSGKSTLSQFIAGWFPRGIHKASQGTVLVNDADWSSLSAQDRTEMVQFVGQVPMQQMSGFSFTVWDEIVFGPGNLGLPADVIRARAESVVEMCNLDDLRERDPFSLSGGEQQRLSIAAALVMQPKALVLDEPTGNFDPESRDALLAQMARLPSDLAIIWCDVALGPPMRVANRFVLLDGGRIVFDGSAAELLAHSSTRDIFGLPAVAEAALLLRADGFWPSDLPLPLSVESAAASLRVLQEANQ